MSDSHTLPTGFRAAGMHCGIKKDGGLDLGLVVADEAMPAAALFTRNELTGAHVQVCREHLSQAMNLVRAVLVNSGNANCGNGDPGLDDARRVSAALAETLGCPTEQVLFISTGVIGARLPVDAILGALGPIAERLTPGGLDDFARAIMTTDTHPKVRCVDGADPEGSTFRVAGVAKGSGMIHPDMATMLSFLMTDGRSPKDMHYLLRGIADESYHCVTVDGDTSPNDTVVLWHADERWMRSSTDDDGIEDAPFEAAIRTVARDLSRMIARDGEGATRLVTVQVRGTQSERDARELGRVIATSPLVKTAVTGRDPNWGRILSAAGRSGVPFQIESARIWIGDADVFAHGHGLPENEPIAKRHLVENDEVILGVDLGQGPYEADVWTCDLTADYVRINGDYRT